MQLDNRNSQLSESIIMYILISKLKTVSAVHLRFSQVILRTNVDVEHLLHTQLRILELYHYLVLFIEGQYTPDMQVPAYRMQCNDNLTYLQGCHLLETIDCIATRHILNKLIDLSQTIMYILIFDIITS
jgi:hypothetical protein